MRIVILGGLDNYGLTMASLATKQGHDVMLLQFPGTIIRVPGMPYKNYEPLIRDFEALSGTYKIYDKLQNIMSTYKVNHKVLRNVDEIPNDVSTILIAYPSLLHESIGNMLKGHIDGKTVITFTDRFLGGFSILQNAKPKNTVKLISIGATPVTSFQDLNDYFQRNVYSSKYSIGMSCYPSKDTLELTKILNSIIPGDYMPYNNLLELAFNCTPSNLHAPHDLFNVVRYEQAHKFTMFHEGFTKGVERVINKISQERCRIAKAFDINAATFLEYEQKTYAYTGDSITENRSLNPQLNKIPAPTSLYSCKGIEDVICSLIPLSDFAKLVNVEVPIINSIIDLWSCYLGNDLRKVGRSLVSLGFKDKTKEEIISIFS